ncbi:MAG: VIT1/CCC1 family protein [Treponema sp.]|jgi:VIT1/CCC1 family predicted Fe2+/Mn2+ transporter|nr:VIT1/CCC1 family protein [Treponema sp.]
MAELIKNEHVLAAALKVQQLEINEFHVYTRLAKLCKDPHNAEVLASIAEAENQHAKFWENRTGRKIRPQAFKIWKTVFLARILGLSFTLKRMEKNEGTASKNYIALSQDIPEVKRIAEEEAEHERELLGMLDEDLLQYAGSIVLGLNDALVELTGALAGFTLALGDSKIISLAGLVTGISASFSMAASEYLSFKAENNPHALKSAFYTGMAYIITVALLILPFLLLSNKFISLGITLALVVLIILAFNYYLATAKSYNFKKRFGETIAISLGVAAFSFVIGFLLKKVLGVDS